MHCQAGKVSVRLIRWSALSRHLVGYTISHHKKTYKYQINLYLRVWMKTSAENTNHVTVEIEETIQATTLLHLIAHTHLPKVDYTPVFLFFLREVTIGYFTHLYPPTIRLLIKIGAPQGGQQPFQFC